MLRKQTENADRQKADLHNNENDALGIFDNPRIPALLPVLDHYLCLAHPLLEVLHASQCALHNRANVANYGFLFRLPKVKIEAVSELICVLLDKARELGKLVTPPFDRACNP